MAPSNGSAKDSRGVKMADIKGEEGVLRGKEGEEEGEEEEGDEDDDDEGWGAHDDGFVKGDKVRAFFVEGVGCDEACNRNVSKRTKR